MGMKEQLLGITGPDLRVKLNAAAASDPIVRSGLKVYEFGLVTLTDVLAMIVVDLAEDKARAFKELSEHLARQAPATIHLDGAKLQVCPKCNSIT